MRERLTALTAALVLVTAAMALTLPGDTAAQKDLGKKYVFENVAFPDGTVGTVFASIRLTRQEPTATASYFDESDGYLGQYRERNGFASDDSDQIREWAVSHYKDRK
jgi:hypothetical protein